MKSKKTVMLSKYCARYVLIWCINSTFWAGLIL